MARHHHIFSTIIEKAATFDPIPLAVLYPLTEVSQRAVCEATEHGLVGLTLVAPKAQLAVFAKSLDIDFGKYPVLDADTPQAIPGMAVTAGVHHG
jgi:hypothetical protein